MKYIFFAALLFSAAAQAEVKPLAQSRTSGGYCPGGCPTVIITIRDDGWVSFDTEGKKKENLIFLKPKLIASLKKEIANYKQAPLVDFQPDAPFCADIPEVAYFAFKDGKKLEIGKARDCHDYWPDPEIFSSTTVVELLKSLGSVNYLL